MSILQKGLMSAAVVNRDVYLSLFLVQSSLRKIFCNRISLLKVRWQNVYIDCQISIFIYREIDRCVCVYVSICICVYVYLNLIFL